MLQTLHARMVKLSFVVCLMTALALGCGKEPSGTLPEPPAGSSPTTSAAPGLEAAKVAPVVLPDAVEAGSGSLLAYVRLREPAKTLDRAAAWTSAVDSGTMSPLNAEGLRQQLQALGIDLSQLRPGANLSIYIFKAADPAAEPGWAALVPTAADSSLAQSAAMMTNAQARATLGDDLLLAVNQATLDAATTAAALLKAISAAPMRTDLQFYLNAAELMAQFGPLLESQVNQIQAFATGMGSMSQDPAQKLQMEQIQRVLSAETTALIDGLKQLKSVTLNWNLDPDAIEFSSVVLPKPGTTMAAFFNKPPSAAPDIARYLGGDGLMRMQGEIADVKTFVDVYMKYTTMMLPADKPELVKELRDMMNLWVEIGPTVSSAAGDFEPGKGLRVEGAYQVGEPEKMMTLMRDKALNLKSKVMSEFASGVTFDVTVKKAARTVEGQPVDQYEIKVNSAPAAPAEQTEALKMLIGDKPLLLEAMVLNKLVLFGFGEPIDALAHRVATGAQGGTLAAMKTFEPGACLYLDLDVIRYTKLVMAMMPALALAVPAMEGSASPISMAAYLQNGAGYFRMKFPKSILGQIKAIREKAMQQAMQQAMPPEQVPGQMPAPPAGEATPAEMPQM